METIAWTFLITTWILLFIFGCIFGAYLYKKRNNKYNHRGYEISTSDPKGNLVMIYNLKGELIMTFRKINGIIQKETINTTFVL